MTGDPVDPLPALRASIDQLIEGAGELARAVKGMHDAFLDAGFDRAQALALSVEWMRTVLRP